LAKHLIKNLIEEDIRAKLVTDLFSVKIDFDRAIFFLTSSAMQARCSGCWSEPPTTICMRKKCRLQRIIASSVSPKGDYRVLAYDLQKPMSNLIFNTIIKKK
jgi:hypothetical protein